MKTCILCNGQNFNLISPRVRDSKKYKIIKCKKCSHVQLYPIPKLEDEKKFYDENLQYKNIGDVGSTKRAYNKMKIDNYRRVELISNLTPKHGSILELGSGHGFFLDAMKKNYDIVGIEVSKAKRKISKKVTSVKVLDIDIIQKIPDIGHFDTIVFFQVLEHISNPVNFLKNCKKLLKPTGKIVAEVPNLDDFQLKLNDSYRKFYWQLAHINYFTPKTLKNVFCNSGLKHTKIFGCQRYSLENMIYWRQNKQPQIDCPSFNLPKYLDWLELFYKNNLVKSLKCDTIISISKV